MKRILPGIVWLFSACHADNTTLFLVNDSASDRYGYVNSKRDTIIPLGKYPICYTDTFKKYAFVLKDSSIVGINQDEKVLFEPYIFDNGPDYVEEGYFRIVDKNKKMGYADTSGVVVIKPQFACAYPFKNGVAEVSNDCQVIHDDPEHSIWKSDNWFYINKAGNRVK